MKKWLGEASLICGHGSSENRPTVRNSLNNSLENDKQLLDLSSSRMGLGVSSQPDLSNESGTHQCHGELPLPIALLASVNRQGHGPYNTTIAVQLHSASSSHSAARATPTIPVTTETQINGAMLTTSLNASSNIDGEECQPSTSCAQPMAAACIQNEEQEQFSCLSEKDSELYGNTDILLSDQAIYGNPRSQSGSDYDITHLPSTSKCVNHVHGADSSPGCGHWCTTCRVKVQVELECVPNKQQRSPNTSRRGIRTLSFPKRVRHKTKNPNKDLNGNHKKKKNPWSLRFSGNCKTRSNKSEQPESSKSMLPSLNMGCASCVCPGYHCTDTIEPGYRSGNENQSSTSSISIPIVGLARLNADDYPLNELEGSSCPERNFEDNDGNDDIVEFVPLNQNPLTLPLSYNSMLDLRMLLENSMRLGLGATRATAIPYTGEPFIDAFPTEGSTSMAARTVHTQVDYIHCLVPDLLAIANCGFYWSKMDRFEAERLLENRPEGTFLLRDSAQKEYLFSVSFRRYGRSLHARIEQWKHKFSFDSHDPSVYFSETVCGLIEHYKDPSSCMFFEPLLTNPLARTFPFPLQHLCRATICSKTTYDGINGLELPKTLKNYLKEYHYKQQVRVRTLD